MRLRSRRPVEIVPAHASASSGDSAGPNSSTQNTRPAGDVAPTIGARLDEPPLTPLAKQGRGPGALTSRAFLTAMNPAAPKLDPASVFSRWITGYEKLDALQCTAERRFASALYDLNHYMKGLGRDLREAGQVFE